MTTQYPKFGRKKLDELLLRCNVEIAGEFELTVLDGKTREVKRRSATFRNLILDTGLDRMGTATWGGFCRIGTGTAAAANGDTALQSQSASTSQLNSVSSANAGTPTYETVCTSIWEFALGAVIGNMAEVGVGWTASTGSTLFSRARINDGAGVPTTITVLSSEILQVTYRTTMYPLVVDGTGTINISAVSYAYTSRCAQAAAVLPLDPRYAPFNLNLGALSVYNGAIGSITASSPAGTNAGIAQGSTIAYIPGTHYIDFALVAAIGSSNLSGGIEAFLLTVSNSNTAQSVWQQIGFVPNIPKNNTNVLNITFRLTWNRH